MGQLVQKGCRLQHHIQREVAGLNGSGQLEPLFELHFFIRKFSTTFEIRVQHASVRWRQTPLESMVLRTRRVASGEVTASLEASVDIRCPN